MSWLSASQVQVFLDCPRKWSFQYQDHIRFPSSNSQDLGTETHRQLEMYMEKREPLLFSSSNEVEQHAARLAQTGLEYLPEPAPHLEMEREFLLITPRHRYYGLIDLVDEQTHTIYDHKTTGNLRYAKDAEGLKYNIQAIIYAVHAMVEWQVPEVKLQWTYMRTRGKELAVPTVVNITEAHAGPVFACIEEISDEIEASRGTPTLSLPPNPNMCSAYGGCPYQHLCQLGPRERLQATMSDNATSDLLARLTKNKAPTEIVSQHGEVSPGQINPPESVNAPEPAPVPQDAPEANVAPANGKRKYTRKDKTEVTITEKPDAAPDALPTKAYKINNLFLGCVPSGNGASIQTASFSGLVAVANQIIQATEFKNDKGETFRLQDYRDMPFGRGPAVLLAAVTQVLDANGVCDCLVVESTSTSEASACLNMLLDASRVIIRAIR